MWGWASAMGDGLPGPSRCALRTPWCSLSVEGDHLPCWKTGVWSRHNGQPGPGRMPSHPSVQTDRPPPLSQTDRHAPLLLSPDRQTDPHPSVQTDRPTTPPLSSGRSAPPPTALSQETGACSQITGGCKVSFPERLNKVLGAPDCFWAQVPPPASGPLCGGISTHPAQRRDREPFRCGCRHKMVGMAWGAALTPSGRVWQALGVSPHPRGCPS